MKAIVLAHAVALGASVFITPALAHHTDQPPMPGMPMPKPTPAPSPQPEKAQTPAPQTEPASESQEPARLLKVSEQSKWPEPIMDDAPYSYALFDLLEYQSVAGTNALRWDFLSWRGRDRQRFWLKSEGAVYPGTRAGGEADLQALYGKLVSPFFDLQIGARVEQRYEAAASPTRVFAVFGLQGLAPGRFEIEPVLFVSNKGKVSGRFTATFDLLQTQRLIFQPRFEADFAVQRDDEFGVERGVRDIEVGLRLRYEIRREVAPYFGISYRQSLGATRSRAVREGEVPHQLQVVFGIRTWR